jgi:anti-anti-sigma factor
LEGATTTPPDWRSALNHPRRAPHDVGLVPKLVVTRTANPDGVGLSAAGEIDCASAPLLVADLDKAIADANGLIHIDLGEVTFMDCSGVHALLAARHSAPTRLRLGRLHPAVRRVLDSPPCLTSSPSPTSSPRDSEHPDFGA